MQVVDPGSNPDISTSRASCPALPSPLLRGICVMKCFLSLLTKKWNVTTGWIFVKVRDRNSQVNSRKVGTEARSSAKRKTTENEASERSLGLSWAQSREGRKEFKGNRCISRNRRKARSSEPQKPKEQA